MSSSPPEPAGPFRTRAPRQRGLRLRRYRALRHGALPVAVSSPARSARSAGTSCAGRPATASRIPLSRRLDGELHSTATTTTIVGGDGPLCPPPGHITRCQSAPDQLQLQLQLQHSEAPVSIIPQHIQPLPQPPPAVSQNAPSHRSSSPTPWKLGHTSFQYRDLAKNEMRLLRILPETSSILRCEIVYTLLTDPDKYTAISYAWGDPDDTRCITLDGHDFPITESLWQALHRLRSRATPVVVWADAICINQQNTNERNAQVQSMTSIYSKAGNMAIWLGPESEDSDLAMQLLQEVVSAPSEIIEVMKSAIWRPNFQALVALFNRDYWKRLWVVQEVINSKSITVYCGHSALPWRIYTEASQIFSKHKIDLIHAFTMMSYSDGLAGNHSWDTLLRRRGPAGLRNMKFDTLGPQGMLRALLHYRSKLCADPRDRVYGILGVLSAHERSHFPIDYSVSTIEIYTNVVDYILTTTYSLDVICASIHYPNHQMMERLPSWVPDWSYYPAIGPLTLSNSQYCASQQTNADFSFSRRRREISIKGVTIGEIQTCGIRIGVPIGKDAILTTFFQWRLQLLRTKGCHDRATHEAFCRTICLDCHQPELRTISDWVNVTYRVFVTLLKERLPGLELDAHLMRYKTNSESLLAEDCDELEGLFSQYFASAIPGRRFAVTNSGLLCLGSGCLNGGDIVCVPLGCSTPIVLRKHDAGYLFVGDIYVDGYMYGKAIDELNEGTRQLATYTLH